MKDGIILILLVVILLMALLGDHRRGPVAVIQDVSARVTKADWPLCVTPSRPPLLRSPESAVDYRLGRPFNDKGVS